MSVKMHLWWFICWHET